VDISDTVARGRALANACEDYTGLYELVWEFNAQFPTAPPAERLRAAQTALSGLVHDGLAVVYHTKWLTDEYTELLPSEAVALVADPEAWRSPADTPDSRYYCFASTDRGEDEYRRHSDQSRS